MAQPVDGEAPDRWGSLLSKLNPIPRFPEFTGPYRVGSVDVEIPVSELDTPAPAPDSAAEIETIQFRIFYPCDSEATGKRIPWLPSPPRDYLSAYIKFLGVGALLAEAASFIPRYLHYTTIPVVENAPILQPLAPGTRWPTMIFSHGLGGSRNAYSQIAGSLASHGVVVFCPEHRDGSAITSYIRVPYQQQKGFFGRQSRREVPYVQAPHNATDEVYELRNAQLRIRLWELGLLHEAILKMDEGGKIMNLSKNASPLDHFSDMLNVHDPGSIIFAGHSFGAATIVQFLKSVFYAGRPELESMAEPLYAPNWESPICRQITSQNVTILLDMWCFPLLASSMQRLFNLPLPAYAPSDSFTRAPPPGGNAILAIESEDFYKWREHLHTTARILSPDPSASVIAPIADTTAPQFFYVKRSAHLNQSDFGLLFPWLTRKVLGSDSPGRALRLNLRALLQVLRVNGITVAGTKCADLVDDGGAKDPKKCQDSASARNNADGLCTDDRTILEHDGNAISEDESGGEELVQAWRYIDIVGMGKTKDDKGEADKQGGTGDEKTGVVDGVEKTEPQMTDVIEPNTTSLVDHKDAETLPDPSKQEANA